jgi:hypothetical protein
VRDDLARFFASFVRRRHRKFIQHPVAQSGTVLIRSHCPNLISLCPNLAERFLAIKFVLLRTNREAAVISKAEEYRAKAQECEEGAKQTRDSFIKEQFLEVAKTWRDMAAYEEKHGR